MAVYVYKDLKQCAEKIAAAFGLSDDDGRRVIGWYNVNQREKIADIIAGDLSGVPAVLVDMGITPTAAGAGVNTSPKKSAGSQNEKNNIPDKKQGGASSVRSADNPKGKQKTTAAEKTSRKAGGAVDMITGAAVVCEEVQAELVTDAGGLPASFGDTVEGWLSDFSSRYDIELSKASGQQWRGACLYVGQHVQNSGVLRDKHREKREGGKIYNAQAVESLLYLWEYMTSVYKHVPLASDFIAFAGVSRDWFYDSSGKGLTSTRADILKKARQIEESGLSAGLVDGRENPTGRIYYSKARLGWRESVEIVHTRAAEASSAGSLPDFGTNGGFLADSGSGSGGSGN